MSHLGIEWGEVNVGIVGDKCIFLGGNEKCCGGVYIGGEG